MIPLPSLPRKSYASKQGRAEVDFTSHGKSCVLEILRFKNKLYNILYKKNLFQRKFLFLKQNFILNSEKNMLFLKVILLIISKISEITQ